VLWCDCAVVLPPRVIRQVLHLPRADSAGHLPTLMNTDAAWSAVAGFLTSLALEKDLAENSREAYRRDLGDLIEYCQRCGIGLWSDVKSADITRYLTELYDLGIAPATVNRRLSAFRGFFAWLCREGTCQTDPAKLVSGPRARRRLPNVLTIAEVEKLLAAPNLSNPIGIRDRAMLEVVYGCGLRVSELVNLKLDAFRLDGRLLLIQGKGGKQRLVPIGGYATQAVTDYLQKIRPLWVRDVRKTQDALFLTQKRGAPMTRQGFWTILKAHTTTAGIETRVTPHTLRHSFATHMLEGGAGLRDVQELLGHASLVTTTIYTEIDSAHLYEVVKTFHPRN